PPAPDPGGRISWRNPRQGDEPIRLPLPGRTRWDGPQWEPRRRNRASDGGRRRGARQAGVGARPPGAPALGTIPHTRRAEEVSTSFALVCHFSGGPQPLGAYLPPAATVRPGGRGSSGRAGAGPRSPAGPDDPRPGGSRAAAGG